MSAHPKKHRISKRISNALVTIFLVPAAATFAQQSGGGAAPQPLPGSVVRERTRAMDDYDRTLNLLKNDAKARAAAAERRRNNFPRINEDFQRIQVIHNEIVRIIRAVGDLPYSRLKELSGEMKSRSNRLKTNLGLPELEKIEEPAGEKSTTPSSQSAKLTTPENPVQLHEERVKESVVSLHQLVASFVANPIFKNLGVVDAKFVAQASSDLKDIIHLSDEIKKSADAASKAAKRK